MWAWEESGRVYACALFLHPRCTPTPPPRSIPLSGLSGSTTHSTRYAVYHHPPTPETSPPPRHRRLCVWPRPATDLHPTASHIQPHSAHTRRHEPRPRLERRRAAAQVPCPWPPAPDLVSAAGDCGRVGDRRRRPGHRPRHPEPASRRRVRRHGRRRATRGGTPWSGLARDRRRAPRPRAPVLTHAPSAGGDADAYAVPTAARRGHPVDALWLRQARLLATEHAAVDAVA